MFNRLTVYLSFIRFSHSVFALPFALAGALLARRHVPIAPASIVWTVIAMVAARSAAMGFNRVVDAKIDALNPRTANRELPRGAMTRREATTFVTLASLGFIYATWRLNPICFLLSPVAWGTLPPMS
jgi:4-hydroxybenzoate polyprenyltransferase